MVSSNRAAALAVSALFFTNGFTLAAWLPRLPELRDNAGLSSAGLGFTLMAAGVAGLAMSAAAGPITDRFGSARTSVTLAIALAVVLPLVGFANSAITLAAAVAMLALTDTISDVAMNAQAVLVQDRIGTSIINRIHGVWSFGTVAGTGLTAVVVAAGIPPSVHLPAVSVCLVAVALATRPYLITTEPKPEVASDAEAGPRNLNKLMLAMLFGLGAVTALTELPVGNWSAITLVDDFNASETVGTLAFGAVTVGMLIGRMVADPLVDRFGRVAIRRSFAGLAGVGILVINVAASPELAILGFGIAGLGVSALFPLLYLAAGKATGGSSVGLSAMTVGMRSAGMIEGPVIGVLATAYSTALALAIVTGTCLMILVLAPPPPGSVDTD